MQLIKFEICQQLMRKVLAEEVILFDNSDVTALHGWWEWLIHVSKVI